YCRGSKHQKNGLAPLEERKRLCDPPNLPNLISFICLFPINMQPLTLFLRKEPGGLSSISPHPLGCGSNVPEWQIARQNAVFPLGCSQHQWCSANGLQQLFHGHHIDEPAVQFSVVSEDPDLPESPFPVQPLAALIKGKGKQDHLVETVFSRLFLQSPEQQGADSLPAPRTIDIDGDIRHAAVGTPVGIGVEGRPALNGTVPLRHQHRVAGRSLTKPPLY